jgi:hypothetical protein
MAPQAKDRQARSLRFAPGGNELGEVGDCCSTSMCVGFEKRRF